MAAYAGMHRCETCHNPVDPLHLCQRGDCPWGGREVAPRTLDDREALKPTEYASAAEALADKVLRAAGSKLRHYERYTQNRILDAAQKALDDARPQPAPDAGLVIPEGCVLVPVEITEDMADAMECEFSTEGQWKAALAARPPVADGWCYDMEKAPRDRCILVAGGTVHYRDDSTFPYEGAATQAAIAYWYHDHWRGEDLEGHDNWIEHRPTCWRPLPAPPAPGRK